ncbi:MAG: argininosuccinate lyase, partial [Candidatus Omnitrophica bacterium]|nr:argininosuccinate lyase [Candidatus Omnitrophota bacterium]
VLAGNVPALLTLLKGVPGSYNRDLQWDKRPLFESTEIVGECTALFAALFEGLRVNKTRAARTLQNDALCATDIAEALVLQGVPFRQAHKRTGALIAYCEKAGIPLAKVTDKEQHRLLGMSLAGYSGCCDPMGSIRRKKTGGGTGVESVGRQIRYWEAKLRASF